MKIVAIVASPRGMRGNTGRLLEEVLAGAADAGAQTEVISLKDTAVGPCIACDACHRSGICSIGDGYEAIKAKLLDCDGFILASPNYIFSVSAQLKALFDRCCGLIHCQSLDGKYAALVETSGGGGDEEVLAYMARFVNVVGARSAGGIGSPVAGIRSFPDEAQLFVRARALGTELCRCIVEQQEFPEQQAFIREFKAHMVDLVDRMQDHWIFERDWWDNKSGAKA